MKKLFLLSIILILLPAVSYGEENILKLRTGFDPGHTRIVLEGPESLTERATVNQKEQNILVTFPTAGFSVEPERAAVPFRKTGAGLVFSPGEFRGLKVLTLSNPSRLVIDVYKDERKGNPPSLPFAKGGTSVPTLEKGDEGGFSVQKQETLAKTGTIVIDPGHGGFDAGIVTEGYAEKNIVLDIAKKLAGLLDKGPLKSSLTRSGDLFVSMGERVKTAKSSAPDIFISLHVGNHREMVIYMPVVTKSVPEDIKAYVYDKGQEDFLKQTVALLNAVKEAAEAEFGVGMVNVRPLPYSILSRIDSAALMIELPSFEQADYSEEFRMKIANTLNRGLYLYEENEAK
ncbi:MAG: N-acetylmuramoyl-L-alanine amidase [Nitrospirae bacterium]|nr:N-acetylmuramoyl-L-alanine amidase [Nitrospirota bacterium]